MIGVPAEGTAGKDKKGGEAGDKNRPERRYLGLPRSRRGGVSTRAGLFFLVAPTLQRRHFSADSK
jgi:hypothetical protein